MPRFNTTTYGKHSIRYIVPKLWTPSLIPKNLRDPPVLSVFRQRIKLNLHLQFAKLDLDSLLADAHCSDRSLYHP